jgi:hypothetical protein
MKISIEICEEWDEFKKENMLTWRHILARGVHELQNDMQKMQK